MRVDVRVRIQYSLLPLLLHGIQGLDGDALVHAVAGEACDRGTTESVTIAIVEAERPVEVVFRRLKHTRAAEHAARVMREARSDASSDGSEADAAMATEPAPAEARPKGLPIRAPVLRSNSQRKLQTFGVSFSSAWTATIARVVACFSIFLDLQDVNVLHCSDFIFYKKSRTLVILKIIHSQLRKI